MRNPQLTETKKENLGFIHRSSLNTAFDQAVNNRAGISKLQALENQCRSFSSPFTEKDLENSQYAALLKIGRKITKKEVLSNDDLSKTKSAYSSGQMDLGKLWDNLIYQVVTQKDFYAKEALVHILKALHVGYVQTLALTDDLRKINGFDLVAKALNAKVVMPKELFVEEEISGSSTASRIASPETSELSQKTQERIKTDAQRDLVVTQALLKKEQLEKLNKELEKIQKSYHNTHSKDYQAAYDRYMAEYQYQREESARILEEINYLTEQKASEEEIRKLYERLKELEFPPFEFSSQNEINIYELQKKLSPESFELFMSLFASQEINQEFYSKVSSTDKAEAISETQLRVGTQTLQIDDSFQTYDDVISQVQNHASLTIQTALENTTLEQTQYANIGGALIPIGGSSTRTHLAYSLLANWNRSAFIPNNGFINFSFEVQDNSWNVANARIALESNTGNHEEALGNVDVLNGTVSFPALMVNKFSSISKVRIDVYFNNGREAYVELFKIPNNELQVGLLTLKPGKEGPREEEPVEEMSTARKLFGLKRLGIAEYMKVVQSTHAYVPGDVTHIENIMAREFKQKSTRRLRKTELQNTSTKSTERETLTDTTTTTRHDIQSEVANVIMKDTSAQAYANWSKDTEVYGRFEVGGSLATHNAKENSVRQAVTQSQEITNKATDKLLTKISEERIEKIIEEYEENNAHGFDNRNGDKHVVGVYRWVDMKYKNQIYNYGKRTMFEFMIPEPARLHRLALAVAKADVLTAPIDPRKAPAPYTMPNPKAATKTLLQYWADVYGVTLTDEMPGKEVILNANASPQTEGEGVFFDANLEIPDGYKATTASVVWAYNKQRNRSGFFQGNYILSSYLSFGNLKGGSFYKETRNQTLNGTEGVSGLNLTGVFNYRVSGKNIGGFNIALKFPCVPNDANVLAWQTENFNAIIEAYKEAYEKFKEEQARIDEEQKEKEAEAKDKMGNFYRYMENDVLKHNCIAYLLQDYLSPNTVGQNFTDGDKMENFQVFLNENLDKYTALAKFMEQAFEWSVMSYSFYPYYWANRQHWQEMYISESVDPLFRSFLQSGMARVIVTVRPGFEDAIQFFLSTGKIWNGEEVPVIGDPMYMSIVDEMREPVGLKQGKPWITKLPTTLTILQQDSAGLKTETALPFSYENPEEFENPEEVVTKSEFMITDAQLSAGKHRFVENIDIKDGNLQLTTDSDPRKVVAQISMQSIKNNLP
ncbi:hypothetical protein [Chryseobacterium sp.]|jgi:hypothetical protein|uniref:hypothetical protein n=1 Tax=Chryseobacterium sp. TaxID=1871047 RepID=UPI002637F42F|nr:hypothetical protein [Chryseobacterium sp.]